MTKNVMTKAWGIARSAQKKFGGKVRQYFSMALKQAWMIVKTRPVYTNLKKQYGIFLDKVQFINGKVRYAVNEGSDFEWFDTVLEGIEVFNSWIKEREDEWKSNKEITFVLS